LGQGKEFERSNEIAALAQSYDSPSAGMQSTIACYTIVGPRAVAPMTNQIQGLFQ
jgi:hypothetical protein